MLGLAPVDAMTSISSVPSTRRDGLIDTISHAHQNPLDRVTGAMQVAEELDEVADSLIGHFVVQARRSGGSWSDIGRSMGMSKQAAQKRFVRKAQPAGTPVDSSQGFSRFNEEARAVVIAAQERARRAGGQRHHRGRAPGPRAGGSAIQYGGSPPHLAGRLAGGHRTYG